MDVIFCLGDALETLRLPIIRGRLLQPGDQLRHQRVAVISQTLAKQVWPREDPIGRHIKFSFDPKEPWITVIGVIKDVKDRLTSNAPRSLVFTTREDWITEMNVLVRTAGDPHSLKGAIRHEVNQIDSSLAAGKIATLDELLNESLSAERFRTLLLASFAVAALLMAMLGIAGLLTYNTAQRTQEFGVRIAVGADHGDLLLLVLRDGLRLSATGSGVGLAVSVVVTHELSALLYNTNPHDLGTFIAVPLILTLVALGATMFPAWRAVRTNPTTALRAE
ncbi:MAG: FtsX-like permease family protein [Bryobacteraceae bacterium]